MPKTPPFFSIIIPTLNEEKHLPALLSDLAVQTVNDFEVIIVDGHSTDNTVKAAESFRRQLSLHIIPSTKQNVCAQRNLGAAAALGRWLVFSDADNRFPAYFLQGLKYKVEVLRPHILSTYFSADSQNAKDQLLVQLANLYIDLQKNSANPVCLESLLVFDPTVFKKLNGFNESTSYAEGNELMHEAVKKHFRFYIVKDPRYTYSLRRLRKQGSLALARNLAESELARLLGQKRPSEKAKKLYPMNGGSFFDTPNPPTTIEKILFEITKVTTLPQELLKPLKPQPSLSKRLKSLFSPREPL